ncbi:MAG: family 78 glycoside hydrolase catalytic domain, partial [Armatimonadota bacterium]
MPLTPLTAEIGYLEEKMSAIVFSLLLLGMNSSFKVGPPPEIATKDADFPVRLFDQKPVKITKIGPTTFLVDFGRVAFGNISIQPSQGSNGEITVHFGEAIRNGRIDRTPPGTVRYKMTRADITGGTPQVVAPAKDARNTEAASSAHPPAILTPPEWGVVLPFRWVEIEGYKGELRTENISRRAAFPKTWDDRAATFRCSDDMLNQVWDLCKYSIKATTFAGTFVDGDRERIPYEADAYLNQLSYYATTKDDQIPRKTFDHLMNHGTWPTEWAPHMVFMAYADWMKAGDINWLKARYDSLKAKILADRVTPDGIVQSSKAQMARDDIVDWPT